VSTMVVGLGTREKMGWSGWDFSRRDQLTPVDVYVSVCAVRAVLTTAAEISPSRLGPWIRLDLHPLSFNPPFA
jgi:hypothetical protein